MIIEWTEPAELDLGDIYEFIARDAPFYAEGFIDRIFEATLTLCDQPRMGREVPEAQLEHIRELIFQNYRIIYSVNDDILLILAVIHQSRELSQIDHKPWEVI